NDSIIRLYKEVLTGIVKYLIFLGWSVQYITHALSRDNDDILRRPVMDESVTFKESRLWNLLLENVLGNTVPY
ncbi:hypothetical protein ACJMK2_038321, partial [Sinanodonta woodiana]